MVPATILATPSQRQLLRGGLFECAQAPPHYLQARSRPNGAHHLKGTHVRNNAQR